MAWLAVTLAVLVAATAVSSLRCCPGDEVLLASTKRCSVTRSHRFLNCSNSMFTVNPNENDDQFLITEDQKLQLEDTFIEEDQYCVTHVKKANGSVTRKEVAFICFPEREEDDDLSTRHTIMGVFMAISTVFLLVTLVVYAVLPEMRDLEGKCLMSAMLALMVSFVVLGTLQFHGDRLEGASCVTIAFVLYYWMLSSFFWLNVVSFNLWRSVVYHGTTWSEVRLFASYCVYGWGCPVILLLVALITHHTPGEDVLRPRFGERSCWFDGNVETWTYFYGPVAIILALNVGFFISTAWSLWKAYSSSEPQLQSLRYKCLLYAKLFVIMGIAWIFELVSHLADPAGKSYFWYVTDIFNCLQGVLIFVITVVCRRRVLRALSRHQPWGLTLPKRWAAGVDAESDAVLTDEVVEMSQPQTPPAET